MLARAGSSALLAVPLLIVLPLSAQEGLHPPVADTLHAPGEYRVFTGGGQPASLDAVVEAMAGHDVVFLGETHDDPTAHSLQRELVDRSWARYGGAADGPATRRVALSMESFDRDVQPVVDEYLAGLITESAFLDAARPWPHYGSDYRPLVELAKDEGIEVIAANAPRRYVTRVTVGGREALRDLPPRALDHLPPLPYGEPSVAYRDQWIATIAEVMEREGTRCGVPVDDPPAPVGAHGAGMGNQLDAQLLWDATMAWSIARHLETRPGALVLHVVGGFHVARGTGTPEQLEAYAPDAEAMIVMLRPVDDPEAFEPAPGDAPWGDFVIQTERARTREAAECRAFLREHGG